MGKKSRTARVPRTATLTAEEVPVVGLREPCPCGSGKRYKACHGRARRDDGDRLVSRPFEGLPGECDWIALREIVPAATAQVRTTAEHGDEPVIVATVLPMALPAMRRQDGRVMAGLQTAGGSGDPSRDVAAAILEAITVEPGHAASGQEAGEAGLRLQDVLAPSTTLDVEVHSGFDFWLEGVDEVTPAVRESMERANSAVVPTARLASVEAAYWARVGAKRHLRWVLPFEEESLLDGLARLHARRATVLVDGSRYVGSFRAHGLLVPVWDLAEDTEPDELEAPAKAFAERLAEAMAVTDALTAGERRARAGLTSRQITLR